MLFMSSVYLFIAAWVTCWKSADLFALVCDVKLCFCHFPMWHPGSGVVLDSIDSYNFCHFSYFHIKEKKHSMDLSKANTER